MQVNEPPSKRNMKKMTLSYIIIKLLKSSQKKKKNIMYMTNFL